MPKLLNKIEEAKEAAFERIMHSANIVKEVLQRNMSLSEDLVKNNQVVDNLNNEIYQMQRENEDLRERLEILETITGKDSSLLLNKIKNVGGTIEAEDNENGNETTIENNSEAQKFNETDLMLLLTDEQNSDDFMIKNKQSIINTIYQLGRDKHTLIKRIENLEKSKIKKTHMKLLMTNSEFYRNQESDYNNLKTEQRFKATLDEGADDVEPIRSILNEEELMISYNNPLSKQRKTKKFKISKQTSMNEKRILPMNKRKSNNQSSKSEIRNTNPFNYGAHFRRTRESFLEAGASDRSMVMLPNTNNNLKYMTGITGPTGPSSSELSTKLNMSSYESGKTSAMNFDSAVMVHPNRLKKSPYEITNYDETIYNVNKPGKYSISAKKYKKRRA